MQLPEFVVLIMWLCCGLPAAGRGGRSEVCTVCRLCCANYSLSYSQVPRPAWADLYTPHLVTWTTTNSNNSNTNNSVTMARTKKQLINQTVNQLKVKRIFSITWPLPCQWWWQCYSMLCNALSRLTPRPRAAWGLSVGSWCTAWSPSLTMTGKVATSYWHHYTIIPAPALALVILHQKKKYDQHW